MKVLCLQGSPRKQGSTATLVGLIEQTLTGAGHEVECLDVTDLDIGGCIGCYRCKRDPDELMCSVEDDAQEVFAKMVAADAIVYASPLYAWGFPGQLKCLVDRHFCLVTGFEDPATTRSHVAGKRVGFLLTCGWPAGEGNTDVATEMFDRFAGFILTDKVAELIVDQVGSPDHLTDEHRKQARAFAEQLAG